MPYVHPEYLIDVDTLHNSLSDDNLRIFDTAVHLQPKTHGYDIVSGRADYAEAHIPGAGFIDLADDWADTSSPLRFTLPALETLQARIGAAGISPEHRVVLYSSGHLMWATRAWWLLYHAGHRNMAILNGNFTAWKNAGLAVEQGEKAYPPATFTSSPDYNAFANTDDVQAGMHGQVCTINSLSKSLYEGTGDFYYVRRGHIPGSKLMYYDSLLDNEHFLPAEALTQVLQAQGVLEAAEVITYCGGGIAATLDAFACMLLGQDNVRVYDGSMSEWVLDDNRPLSTGAAP